MVTDAELISRSVAGDGESFVEMISRHEVFIGAYLHRRVGQSVAEELLAEVDRRLQVTGDVRPHL